MKSEFEAFFFPYILLNNKFFNTSCELAIQTKK